MQNVPHHLNRCSHGTRRDLVAARRRPARVRTPYGASRLATGFDLHGCRDAAAWLGAPPGALAAGCGLCLLAFSFAHSAGSHRGRRGRPCPDPPDLNVNPTETVVKPGTPRQASADPPAPPGLDGGPTTFALPDAIAFALRNSPRLRSARAVIERARGQEQVAFAPFLPQIDLLGQYGVVSATFAPGIPGNEGFILANGFGTRSYAQTEVGLQWTLYDFGRTGGRYRQAVARERITQLQLARAVQTVAFDVAIAYLDVLLARASRRVQEDAVHRAEA